MATNPYRFEEVGVVRGFTEAGEKGAYLSEGGVERRGPKPSFFSNTDLSNSA